jgi:hypothetical protein
MIQDSTGKIQRMQRHDESRNKNNIRQYLNMLSKHNTIKLPNIKNIITNPKQEERQTFDT